MDLSIYLSFFLSLYLSNYLSIHLSNFYLSIYLSIFLSIYLSIDLPIIYPSIYYLSSCLFIYLIVRCIADADESRDASGELTVWDWSQHPGVSSLDTDRLSPRKHTGKTIFTISIGYRKLVMTLRSYVKYLLRLARVQHPKNRSSWETLPLGKKN